MRLDNVNFLQYTTGIKPVEWQSQNTEQSKQAESLGFINFESCNRDLSPKYLATAKSGDYYTNGLGASKFSFNVLG